MPCKAQTRTAQSKASGSLNAGSLFNQGINGPLPPGHLHPAKHHAPAHHAPPPAKAAQSCTPKPPPAHRHAPRPAPLPSDTTPIITWHDAGSGTLTGLRHTVDFFRGAHDQGMDMSNPFKMYEGLHQFGQDEADIYIPSADGTTKDGDAYARQKGRELLDSFNPLNKKSAYDTGKTATNIGSVIVPGIEELNALRGLKAVARAADGDVVATSAAAERAAGTPGAAAAEDALRAAKARQVLAHEAYQAKLPGAGVRKVAAKAKAAGRKLKNRRAGGAEPPVRTPEQVAAAEQKFNSQKQGALEEARHQQLNRRQPALAGGRSHPAGVARPSEAPSGPSTAAIGQPSVMKAVSHGAGHTSVPSGRVAAPGGRVGGVDLLQTDADVPKHYRTDPARFTKLAEDPDQGGKVSKKTRAEAMSGLEVEHQGLVPGPITRGPNGIEFYDADGVPWDVKTPISPVPGSTWAFDAKTVVKGMKKELLDKKSPNGSPPGTYENGINGVPEPRRIILDSSYMNSADHAALRKEMDSTLNQSELQRIVEINTHL